MNLKNCPDNQWHLFLFLITTQHWYFSCRNCQSVELLVSCMNAIKVQHFHQQHPELGQNQVLKARGTKVVNCLPVLRTVNQKAFVMHPEGWWVVYAGPANTKHAPLVQFRLQRSTRTSG
jgi:hypothetical protein